MSNVSIKISNIEALKKIVREQVMASHLPKIETRVRNNIRPIIEEMIIEELKQNVVYQGIQGRFAGDPQRDIQAHMGLYDFLGEEAAYQIEKAFRASLKVNRNNTGIGFTIIAEKIEDNVLNIDSGSYVSESTRGAFTIPWIEWLLKGTGSVGAAIVFLNREVESSRSGRAIMNVNSIDNAWDMQNYTFGQGPNFIEQVLENPGLRTRLKNLVVKEFRDEVKRYYG